jgi:hypothetical protein
MREGLVAALALGVALGGAGCSVFYTRPTQEMSDTSSAIRAAREVQADTLAPELYRQSNEWFFRAKREYKFKNFKLAKEYADKARFFAEQAEFESLRNGGTRTEHVSDPMATTETSAPAAPATAPTPYEYPTPQGTPAENFEKQQSAPQAPVDVPPPPVPTPAPQPPS